LVSFEPSVLAMYKTVIADQQKAERMSSILSKFSFSDEVSTAAAKKALMHGTGKHALEGQRAATAFVTTASVPETFKVSDAVWQALYGTLGSTAIAADNCTKLGGVDTIQHSLDELSHVDVQQLRSECEKQAGIKDLEPFMSERDYAILSNFVTWPDAYLWKSVAEVIKKFDGKDNIESTLVLVNTISECSPYSTHWMSDADISKTEERIGKDAETAWLDFMKGGGFDMKTASELDRRAVFASAAANCISAIADHGLDFMNGKLPKRQVLALSLCTMIGRGIVYFDIGGGDKGSKKPQ
jgi:hypothetical protein